MDVTRIIVGAAVGAVVTGVCSAIALYMFGKVFPSSGDFMSFGINWLLAILLGTMYAAPVGGLLGAIIAALQLDVVKSTVAGFFLGMVLSITLLILGGGDSRRDRVIYFVCAVTTISAINGAAVSIVNSWATAAQNNLGFR